MSAAVPGTSALAPVRAKPLPRRSSRLLGALKGLRHYLPILVGLSLWEAGVRCGLINGDLVPPPSAIFHALIDLSEAGLLWRDIVASVLRIVVGFGLATIVAVPLGLFLGRSRRVAPYVNPLIELIRPISVLAWIPLAILWFGIGNESAWFIIFLGSFFPIFTNTYLGARSVALIHLRVAQSFGASPWLFARSILLPSTLPYVMAGLRVGLGVGWTCVIAAELIAATSGLGYMIQLARTLIETEKVMAGMIVIGIVGFVMNGAMLALERRIVKWKPDR